MYNLLPKIFAGIRQNCGTTYRFHNQLQIFFARNVERERKCNYQCVNQLISLTS